MSQEAVITPGAARTREPALVSVIATAFNEEECIPLLYQRVRTVFERMELAFELLIVDNGSTDGSLAHLRRLRSTDARVRYVSLSRNFGHQGGLVAALDFATGDVVISMDADLQHPPELIPEMLARWRDGYDAVYMIKMENAHVSVTRRFFDSLFYRSMRRMTGLDLKAGQSDFRLLDRRVVDALNRLPERQKFLRGLVSWLGFRQVGIEYTVAPRAAGTPKFRASQLVGLALDGILSFSTIPLRLLTIFGFFVAGPAFLYAAWAFGVGLYTRLLGHEHFSPPGWAALAVAVMFFGGVQLIALGLLGEYIGRVYAETKGRPSYIVTELSDPADRRETARPSVAEARRFASHV